MVPSGGKYPVADNLTRTPKGKLSTVTPLASGGEMMPPATMSEHPYTPEASVMGK